MKRKKLLYSHRTVLSAVILTGALILPIIHPALSIDAEAADDTLVVVSLGDSYTSGEGIEPFYGQDKSVQEKVQDYNWIAHRSQKCWPSQLEIAGLEGKLGDYYIDYTEEYSVDNSSDENDSTENDSAENDSDKNASAKNDIANAADAPARWYLAAATRARTKHFYKEQKLSYSMLASNDDNSSDKSSEDNTENAGFSLVSGSVKLPAQLEVFDHITDEIDYVTLTLGGNEVGFEDIITECVVQPEFLNPTNMQNRLSHLWEDIDTKTAKIEQAYRDTADAAGAQAQIIVAGYPRLLSEDGTNAGFTIAEAKLINSNVHAFNEEIRTLVENSKEKGINIEYVDVEEDFAGHEAYSEDPYINSVILKAQPQDLNQFFPVSSYSMHPNEKGAGIYAQRVGELINAQRAEE